MKSEKRTILIFTDWYLPGYKAGGPISSCANLVELLGDDFNFKVVCGDRDYLETEPYAVVEPNKWIPVGKAQVMYLSPDRQKYGTIQSIIEQESADKIYLNGMFSKVFTLFPLIALRNNQSEVIVAPRGMLAPAAMGLKSFKKKAFLSLAKVFKLYSKVKFHATNSVEAHQISAWFGKIQVAVVENIPDLTTQEFSRKGHMKIENRLRLYSVARIAPEKNIHFALKCLKNIEPDIKVSFTVIGAIYNPDYYALCQKIVAGLENNVEVNFIGSMPKKEIPQIANEADFFFLPTAGENYGHAIVEALIHGVPVIISTKTPWRNLKESKLGFDVDLIEKEFSKTINEVGRWGRSEYETEYKKIRINAGALINLNKLRTEYTNIFDGRD